MKTVLLIAAALASVGWFTWNLIEEQKLCERE